MPGEDELGEAPSGQILDLGKFLKRLRKFKRSLYDSSYKVERNFLGLSNDFMIHINHPLRIQRLTQRAKWVQSPFVIRAKFCPLYNPNFV